MEQMGMVKQSGRQGQLLALDSDRNLYWNRNKRAKTTTTAESEPLTTSELMRAMSKDEISEKRMKHRNTIKSVPITVREATGGPAKRQTLGQFLKGKESSLSMGQVHFLRLVADNKHVFVTGGAGVGKSYILKLARDFLTQQGALVHVTALTGPAATLVNGCTLHSWMGISAQLPTARQLAASINSKKNRFSMRTRRWKETSVLIIDEISMAHYDLFQLLCDTMALVRCMPGAAAKQTTHNFVPTGTIRLIVMGDFLQLPPVVRPEEQAAAAKRRALADQSFMPPPSATSSSSSSSSRSSKQQFAGHETQQKWLKKFQPPTKASAPVPKNVEPYAFLAQAWRRMFHDSNDNCVQLTKVFRQAGDDPQSYAFIVALNEWRIGKLSPASIALLETRRTTIDKVAPDQLFILTHLWQIRSINARKLKLVKGEACEFTSQVGYENEARSQKTPAEIESVKKRALANCGVEPQLELRVGARVMLRINLDVEHGLVNGSQGTVVSFARTKAEKAAASGGKNGGVGGGSDVNLSKKRKATSGIRSDATGVVGADGEASQSFKKKATERKKALNAAIRDLDQPYVVVRFDSLRNVEDPDEPVAIQTHAFNDEVAGTTVLQMPLVLAYAITVHKSQGASLDSGAVDISGSFASGQGYVAMSRFKTLNRVDLLGWDPDKIRADPVVLQYHSTLPPSLD